MTKQFLYTYFGTNGTIISPVQLEGVMSLKKVVLTADEGKMMTNGSVKVKSATVAEADVDLWSEV